MSGTSIEFVNADQYFMYFFEGEPGCAKVVKLPPEYEPFRGDAKPLPLLPGREFMFSMGAAKPQGYFVQSCISTVAFTPEAGAKYRARFVVEPDRCAAVVVKTSSVTNQFMNIPEPSLRKIDKNDTLCFK
ncbi:hypothetical protein [Roseateles chitinivorans]|uniref:hypothetical protein n=1 Tax=Roseateles chitinivorans TaxID=2917965 RepID=UPI00118108F0|nr:hypothetical protein [Roseateles chitinivorans]